MLGSLWFSCEGALASEISQKPNQRKSIKAVFLWFILHSYSRGACVNLSANLLAMPLLMSVLLRSFFPSTPLSLPPTTQHCLRRRRPSPMSPSPPRSLSDGPARTSPARASLRLRESPPRAGQWGASAAVGLSSV